MKIAEQKRASTAGRNDNDGHHAIDSSTARTDKQSNVFKSTDDGDGLKGRNKNLRRNKMKEKTRKEVLKLIELNNIQNPDDERIETCIADRFPEEYSNEAEYISFQEQIAEIIN